MRLSAVRYAETIGDARGRRNATLGVVKHLWRSPVPFVGFYAPEGKKIAGRRHYVPRPPKHVDDTEYLAGVEAHKRSYAEDLQGTMLPAGRLPGYFEAPTDEGWRVVVDVAEKRLELADAWGHATSAGVVGNLEPFVWAYRRCGFCLVSVFDKDLGELRDDLLFVAKREGVELRWRQTAA
jgi:hypothetical protein